MVIKSILRMIVLTLLPATLCGLALGAEESAAPSKSVQYKRADTNFYARGDVLKSDPGAVIVTPTNVAQNGDTYTYAPKKKAPKTIYIETPSDWIEPITPPDMPASLNIPPDAMQVREPQGDVQFALPNSPTVFTPATNGLTLPNGSVIKTGTNATAAILFGGVFSARLMPDSEAAVQQTVTATSRSAEVDLTAGGVFSKVGTQVGVTSDYQVHSRNGAVLAQGGDFATFTTARRTDVWVSQGTVELLQPDGTKVGSATGNGTGPLKLIRFPAIANSADSMQADAESLTTIMNFIPIADQKLAALHAKEAKGTTLTPNEQAYVQRIKQVPALIKLALVEVPPAELDVLADGTVGFQGATLSLVELQAKLKDFVAKTYDPNLVVKAGQGATYAGFQEAMKACKATPGLRFATTGDVPPKPAPPPPPPAPTKPLDFFVHGDGTINFEKSSLTSDELSAKIKATETANPGLPVTLHADPKLSYVTLNSLVAAGKAAAPTSFYVVLPPAKELTVTVHGDGTILFHGATLTLDQFTPEIKAAVVARPDLSVVVHSNPKMDYAKFTAVTDACKAAQPKQLTIVQPAPQPPPPAPPKPLDVVLQPGGSVKFQGASMPVQDFISKLKDALAATPDAPVKLHAGQQADYEHVADVLDAIKSAGPKNFSFTPPATKELTIAVHGDSSILFHGATVSGDAFAAEIKAAVALYPDAPIIVHSNPKADYTKFQAVVDACHATSAKEVTVVQPAPEPPKPVAAAPAPLATPPTVQAPPPIAPEKPAATPPVSVIVHQDGSIKFQGKTMHIDEFTAGIKDVVTAHPDVAVIIHSNPKMDYAKFEAVVDACKNAPANEVDVVPPAPQAPTPMPSPTISETPATPATPASGPATVNDKPVPAEIDLAADGLLTLDGAAITEDELKAKLADIKATNPKNPLVLMKQPKVTKDQWKHYVDLCHTMGLKLLVKNAKAPAIQPMAATPPTLRPSAAEGGPTPPPASTPTPAPESAAPAAAAPSASADESVPVEIELTPDGQTSFLGENVSEADLKTRLASVAQSNAKEPVLIVKDEKVTRDQWQHVVDLCHAAKLKVKMKTVKSSDSGALKPHAQLPVALSPTPGAGGRGVLPVEIGLASKGRLTFEGTSVTLDELEARLATAAKGNPNQPVVIMKRSDVPDDSADALVTLCQEVSSNLKITVKNEPAFTPPAPPDGTSTENPDAPAVHMHASMDALNTNTPAPSP